MLKKYFIPYDRALKLKELGFDEECLGFYWVLENYTSYLIEFKIDKIYKLNNLNVNAPLFCQVFDWFREKYDLHIEPRRTLDERNWYYFYINLDKGTENTKGSFLYEEAQLACLDKLIEICSSVS